MKTSGVAQDSAIRQMKARIKSQNLYIKDSNELLLRKDLSERTYSWFDARIQSIKDEIAFLEQMIATLGG